MPSDVIQWFPGHMAKTRRMITENLKKVDLTIELLDSRIPASSRNPEIAALTSQKPRLTLASKCSLADAEITSLWKKYFEERGETCLFYDCRTGEGINGIAPAAKRLCAARLENWHEKGMDGRMLRAMIVGIPNVGKSSLINRLASGKKAKVEDRPGVTLDKQWVSTSIGLDLLDMPGVLWPKFDDRRVGENLALTGAIKDQVTNPEELASVLCIRLKKLYPALLCERYRLDAEKIENMTGWDIVNLIAEKRGFLLRGGETDSERCSKMLIGELRDGKIGRISFEKP